MEHSHLAYDRALELGAQPMNMPTGPMELRLPAIKGISGPPQYLIDRFEDGQSIYDFDVAFLPGMVRKPREHDIALLCDDLVAAADRLQKLQDLVQVTGTRPIASWRHQCGRLNSCLFAVIR